jgi:hypothetical protein
MVPVVILGALSLYQKDAMRRIASMIALIIFYLSLWFQIAFIPILVVIAIVGGYSGWL